MPTAKSRDLEARERRKRWAAALDTARDEFVVAIQHGRGGKQAHARFCERVDDLVRDIVETARTHTALPVAVAALGGYGRRTLCLYSDIDLLIIVDGRIGRAEERFVKAVLHPLWDLRLTVGHHVREASELGRLERNNPEFLLALVDARLLVGEVALFRKVREPFEHAASEWAAPTLEELMQLIDQRHEQFTRTIYQLEPDVKDSPGALRDIAAAEWIRLLSASTSGAERDRLEEAEEFLLRIRSLLHLDAGRNLNILSHPLQEKVADALGYAGAQMQQRVEALMGDYFRYARTVNRSLEWWRKAVRRSGFTTNVPAEPVGDNLELDGGEIRFVDEWRAASDPASWLTVFQAAIDHNCEVSTTALACIERNVERYPAEAFVASEVDRRRVFEFLRPRRGLYGRLSEMHDCGLLGRIFPEFNRIQCRVIRDFYHKYTVDEHTLLTIRTLEALHDPQTPSRERFRALLGELREPALLSLALLFHDVGKWKDEDHHIESVRMAQTMLDRLRLSGEPRQIVEFLIHNHLQMSRAAFRRDTEDPEVVRQFAGLIGTEELLKLLCLMTLADVQAVSPETLTPWKEELLWRLYVDTYNYLTLAYADDLIQRGQEELAALNAGRPADVSESELARFLGGLPRRYLALFPPETIYRHVRLSRNMHPDEVHFFLEPKPDIWELTVATLDKPYLFSNISGVLAYFGMNILRGQALTTPDGLVLDVFQFTDQEGFFRHNPGAMPQFYRVLEEVVAGAADVTALLRGKERSVLYRRPQRVAPVIYFDNEHSQKYTVLEIIADDALGLLHRISRVISRQGCDVDLVLISTEGDRAVDVFHVTKVGIKLDEASQAELAADLERMLEGGYEAH